MRIFLPLLLAQLVLTIAGPSLAIAASGDYAPRFGDETSLLSNSRPAGGTNGLIAPFAAPGGRFSCISAINSAERRYGIPASLLKAIGKVESGRPAPAGDIEPWPWTVNAEGRGLFFGSKVNAASWVRQQQRAGVRSIDVGCLQINLANHPDAFHSMDEAFDPAANADYAGRFLLKLYHETGSWATAIGYYHSQTVSLATAYRERVRLALRDSIMARCFVRPSPMQQAWAATLVLQQASGFSTSGGLLEPTACGIMASKTERPRERSVSTRPLLSASTRQAQAYLLDVPR